MNDIYSIGETSKINDISIKALRHYDEIGLLKPKYTDPQNGYRYYTYDQFSFIDKIKRFKNIGMSLKELKEIFYTKDLSLIECFLHEQKKVLEAEALALEERKRSVEMLSEFFEYSKLLETTAEIFTKHIDERTVLSVPCDVSDDVYSMDMELRRVIALPEISKLQVLNPYGYILDFNGLMNNRFAPIASTVSVRGKLDIPSEYYKTIPAGEYLCFKGKILSNNFDARIFIDYCKKHNLSFDFIIACEYLKSLYDPDNSPYEIQALLKK